MNSIYKVKWVVWHDLVNKMLFLEYWWPRLYHSHHVYCLKEDERLIAENFGSGTQVDVSDITVEYDLAAQLGKYMGLERCQQLYNRCDLSSSDMVRMIKTEMDNLDRMKRDLDNEEVEIDSIEKEEEKETEAEFENLEKDDDAVNWVWS